MSRKRTFECPCCGADVVLGARACKECGSDARTGWQSGEEIDYQSIEIPDGYGGDGDPDAAAPAARRRSRRTAAVALLCALALLLAALLRWI